MFGEWGLSVYPARGHSAKRSILAENKRKPTKAVIGNVLFWLLSD